MEQRHTLAYQSNDDIWEYVASTEAEDRYGDVIDAKGWILNHFKKNPIALFQHRSDQPIGIWENIRVEGDKLLARLKLAAPGTSFIVDFVRQLIEQRVLKAVSVGFLPRKYERIEDKDGKWTGGFRFTKSELMEISVVSVPANPEALSIAKSVNLPREMFGGIFSKSGRIELPRANPPEDVRQSPTVPNEHSPSDNISPGKGQKMSLQERIAAQKTLVQETRDAVLSLSSREDRTEDENERFRELTKSLKSYTANLRDLEDAEAALTASANSDTTSSTPAQLPAVRSGGGSPMPVTGRLTPVVAKKSKGDLLVRSALVAVRSFLTHRSADEIIRAEFDNDQRLDAIVRAVTNPATTVVPSWAGELIGEEVAAFMDLLRPDSIFFRLPLASFTFGNSKIRLPTRGSGKLNGDFVGEGQPIPVKSLVLSSVLLEPKKLGVITVLTEELARMSAPAAEPLFREIMVNDTRDTIDTLFLDTVAANAIRPAGMRSLATGSETRVSSGTTLANVIADLKAPMSRLSTLNMGRRNVWIINNQQLLSLMLMTNAAGTFAFRDELSTGNLLGYPYISSTTVPAGVLFLVDASELAAAFDANPELEVSNQATLHMESTAATSYIDPETGLPTGATANTVKPIAAGAGLGVGGTPGTAALGDFAQPVTSLWQTWSLALRLVWPMTWVSRRAGAVQTVTGIAW